MNPIQIDSSGSADLRQLIITRQIAALPDLDISGFSVGGLIELTCLGALAGNTINTSFQGWIAKCPVLRAAFEVLNTGKLSKRPDMWSARQIDFFPIRDKQWSQPARYHPYESRFRKAAVEAGFGKKADAFTGALFEMADNIVQHSGPNTDSPAIGIIGYYICPAHISFAVADLGCGVLSSLRRNPQWSSLPNSKAALTAILQSHASSRQMAGEGEGFKQLFRSLTDFNGIVEMRSGNGRLKVTQVPGGREAQPQFIAEAPGLQLSVSCSLNGNPREEIFSIDYLT